MFKPDPAPKMTKVSRMGVEDFSRIAYGEWWEFLSIEQAQAAHLENVEACREAVKQFRTGPIRVLAISGSGRDTVRSCAHELSNSRLLMEAGIEGLDKHWVEVEFVNLREYNITPCNNCYSTASALCGFPCNCFPFDPMQALYPKVLRSEVLLMSTGVNQSAMSTRLKAFSDRLVSLDGGYYVAPEQFGPKTPEWKSRMVTQSLEHPVHYDQRIQGRVCAFFITSKDEADTGGVDERGVCQKSYIGMVADSLYRGFYDYGCEFADPWYAWGAARPDEDLSLDKQRLSSDVKAQTRAREVVEAAVARACWLRTHPGVVRRQPPGRT